VRARGGDHRGERSGMTSRPLARYARSVSFEKGPSRKALAHDSTARGSAFTAVGQSTFGPAVLLFLSSRPWRRRPACDLDVPRARPLHTGRPLLFDTLPRLRPGARRASPLAACIQRLRLDANALDRSTTRPLAKRPGPRPGSRTTGRLARQLWTARGRHTRCRLNHTRTAPRRRNRSTHSELATSKRLTT
jgi:hypothetical protein